MLIEEEQSLHTWSGRSFAQEYSLEARGLVTPTNQPTAEKGQESDPFSCDLVGHLARIPAKVSLFDLLKLDKLSRRALVPMLKWMDSLAGR